MDQRVPKGESVHDPKLEKNRTHPLLEISCPGSLVTNIVDIIRNAKGVKKTEGNDGSGMGLEPVVDGSVASETGPLFV